MKSNDAMIELCAAMRDECGAGADFEVALGELIGKARTKFEFRMRDRQAADLLALGPTVAAERLGVCRRSVYYMSERARKKVQATA